jgi:hypothetical protein
MKLVAKSLVLVVLAALSACSRQAAVWLPDAAPGWSRSGEVRQFSAKNLYQYMDGEADKYVQAGVKQTITADYRHRSGLQATADVFVMSAGLGPRQLFGAEPGTDAKGVALGEAARVYRSSLVFRKGRYFVRVVAFGEGIKVPVQLVDLAHAIDEQLK